MQAMFHMFSAITGHTQSRKISQKTEDGYVELRPQEKINDSMETAKRHLNLYRELAETISETGYDPLTPMEKKCD
jgi:hypothetical protein